MVSPALRCSICKEKWKDEVRESKGCEVPVKQVVSSWDFAHTKTYKFKIKFFRCPTNFSRFYYSDLFNQLDRWKNGHEFFNGGILEYPAKFVDLMDLLDNIAEEYKQGESARLKKYNGRSSKR